MKTSNILFILTIIVAYLVIRYYDSVGKVTMTRDNQPTNTLSEFWLKMYDLKVTQELPESVKQIKILGNGIRTIHLNILKSEKPSLLCMSPQNFKYSIEVDTLIIHNTGGLSAHITLQQPLPIEHITVYQAKVYASGFHQDKLSITAQKDGHFSTGGDTRSRKDSVAYLDIYATERSSVDLTELRMNSASAVIENAVLSYDAKTEADSLRVMLKKRSTVTSQDRDVVNQINNLIVSGDKQYFKKEFIGKGVNVITKD